MCDNSTWPKLRIHYRTSSTEAFELAKEEKMRWRNRALNFTHPNMSNVRYSVNDRIRLNISYEREGKKKREREKQSRRNKKVEEKKRTNKKRREWKRKDETCVHCYLYIRKTLVAQFKPLFCITILSILFNRYLTKTVTTWSWSDFSIAVITNSE